MEQLFITTGETGCDPLLLAS